MVCRKVCQLSSVDATPDRWILRLGRRDFVRKESSEEQNQRWKLIHQQIQKSIAEASSPVTRLSSSISCI